MSRLTGLAAILCTTAALAQDAVGDWQGTLRTSQGQEFRIVIRIGRAGEGLRAALHNADRAAQPVNATSVAVEGATLRFTLASGAMFEGRFTADGNSLSGIYTQATPVPLTLVRATRETAWAIPDPPPPAKPMAADADPSFEVATIKPSEPNRSGQSIQIQTGRFSATNSSLYDQLIFAYNVHPRQLRGAPAWAETDRFDIVAAPDREGMPSGLQTRAMLQKLLAERFGLRFHREPTELAAYTIAADNAGAKMTRNEGGGVLPNFGVRGPGAINARNSTVAEFAAFLQAYIVDRPVVDRSGVTGRYDFTLAWRPDQLGANAAGLPDDLASRPDIFTAMREQLGLRFQPERTTVDAIVIDRVERPSAN